MWEQACPILPSRDFSVTETFYKRLDFDTWYKDNDYLLMNRDKVELHFFSHPKHTPETCDHEVYIRPKSVDVLSDQIEKLDLPRAGAFPKFLPAEDKPWGMREAALWDPDGTLLRIGEETTDG
ncbi:bleomycin resistance protein [Tateyamaria omphalii]|uniref:bleomycin resistance protein n=1 Tax=Tateyamaria omphalii TaxID=299262 RepID=UPI00167C038D|nr:VOC family protein [Tateyamaria omphalii]GGX51084.1 bleomycin resistance protein [Tateyamaria omphalii]